MTTSSANATSADSHHTKSAFTPTAARAGTGPLFTPLRVGTRTLTNRIIMAPLTRLRTGPRGIPGPLNAEYYRQRASAGMIITEGTSPSQRGRGYQGQPGIFDDAQTAGWALVTDLVHQAGGVMALQVHHAGRLSHSSLTGGLPPVAPSAIAAKGEVHTADGGKAPYPVPHALTPEEIPGIIEEFKRATARAMTAGFDFVELHNANGYLPHEFLSRASNARTDHYGGSIENRTRFTLEVLAAMASVAGPERVGVKFTIGPFPPHDITVDDEQELYPYLAKRLSEMGVAFIEAQRPITNWGVPPIDFDPFGLLRGHFRGALIGGAMFTAQEASETIAAGRLDAVAFGRPFIGNPDLPARLAAGAPLVEADQAIFYSPGPEGYTTFPPMAAG